MRLLIPLVLTAFLMLGGCVQNRYNWNGYDKGLYEAYKDPNQIVALQIKLQETVDALEKEKQVVPPGMYAELGTLYLQDGDVEKAKTYYAKERSAWPESKTLMDVLIKNLETRKAVIEKAKK
jgi:hypothetical protein